MKRQLAGMRDEGHSAIVSTIPSVTFLGKGPLANTCKGALMQKIITMKFMGEPHRKKCKLNLHWKMYGNFLPKPHLQGSKLFMVPFLHQAPLTSVCERSLKGETLTFPVF